MESKPILPRVAEGITGKSHPDEEDESALVAALRAGDQDALAVLYGKYRTEALAFARRLVRNEHDAEDVVQEAFTKTLNAIDNGFGPSGAFRPYLYTAIKSTAIRCWQHRLRESPAETLPDERDIAYDDRIETVLAMSEHERILTALGTLNQRWQRVLWYADVLQEPPRRIGPMMGIAPNAVSALVRRARAGLRDAYMEVCTSSHVPDRLEREGSAGHPHLSSGECDDSQRSRKLRP